MKQISKLIEDANVRLETFAAGFGIPLTIKTICDTDGCKQHTITENGKYVITLNADAISPEMDPQLAAAVEYLTTGTVTVNSEINAEDTTVETEVDVVDGEEEEGAAEEGEESSEEDSSEEESEEKETEE